MNRYKKHIQITSIVLLIIMLFPLINLITTIKNQDNINLHIDEKLVNFNIKPIEYKNKIYLPLIEVMTELGYENEVDISKYRIDFQNTNRTIAYRFGKSYGYINNKFTHFSRPTIFKNGVVFASLDTIQKMTSTYSKWTMNKKDLYLETPPKIKFIEPKNDMYISTYNKSNHILGQIIDDELFISGYIDNGFAWTVDSVNKNSKLNIQKNFLKNNSFESIVNINKSNISNNLIVNANRINSPFDHNTPMNIIPRYDLEIFSLDELENEKIYNHFIDSYVFANPTNYNENIALYNEHSLNHPKNFLSLDFIKDDEELEEIKSLALYITRDIESDYDKVFAIHNWIVENLSYDYGKYYSNDWSGQDPYLAMKEKKTLCEGFAFLNMALCRSINIPSKLVFGFASKSDISREDLEGRKYGHAWNEIFVDNRWVIVDSTWDTKNTYNNGFFVNNINSFLYFDVSLKQLSNTHLIEVYPIY